MVDVGRVLFVCILALVPLLGFKFIPQTIKINKIVSLFFNG